MKFNRKAEIKNHKTLLGFKRNGKEIANLRIKIIFTED